MLKMVLNTNQGRLFIFGLSYTNLDKLRAGMPIMFETSEIGIKGSKFIIMGGKTEETLEQQVMGMLPTTRSH